MTLKIYHNPRCSKSRQTLEIIKSKTKEFKIIKYLVNPLTFKEIKLLLKNLKLKPIQIVRVQESIWKEKFKTKKMDNDEIIYAIVNNPILMGRPIATKDNKAIIGRPPENVLILFS